MKVRRFAMQLGYSLVGVLVLTSFSPSRALAQDHDAHMMTSQRQPHTAEQEKQENALVKSSAMQPSASGMCRWLRARGMVSSSAASAEGTMGRWDSTT
jgi:hypothetical protein